MGGDSRPIEPEQHPLRLDAVDAQAHEMREPVGGVAVDLHAGNVGHAGAQPVRQAPLVGHFYIQPGLASVTGRFR